MTNSLLQGFVQWRIKRLQVFNWGTFSNIHDIPISPTGFLFVGASGSGKSTLLDALVTLLFPNPAYNAAAREGEGRRSDRSLLTYVRGAWSTQSDAEATGGPRAKVQYLRREATFSAVAVTLVDTCGAETTLMLVACIRKSANEESAINRQYFIINGAYSFNKADFEGFVKSQFDWRWLKSRLPELTSFTRFNAYMDAFCDRFGIRHPAALKLLAKAQSAKNLGELNTFLRTFMLEEPRTFEMAERLTAEFDDLSKAHQEVLTAKAQCEILTAARTTWDKWRIETVRRETLERERDALPWWVEETKRRLLAEELPKLTARREDAERTKRTAEDELDAAVKRLEDLRLEHAQAGGAAIARLVERIENLRTELARVEVKERSARRSAAALGRALPDQSAAWPGFVEEMRGVLEQEASEADGRRTRLYELAGDEREKKKAFEETVAEVQSLRARPSNIPAKNLDLRAELAGELGLTEADLPFAGELLQVKPEEAPWQGAMERVLHNFALSILVDDRHYAAFTELLEKKRLHGRVVYYRVRGARDFDGFFRPRSIASKLDYKAGRWFKWLAAECAARFPHLCAETLEEFRRVDQAVTRAGQVKHSAERHEKDDRTAVDDRRRWVTGFTNKEKLAAYEEDARRLAETVSAIQKEIRDVEEKAKNAQERLAAASALINTEWVEIDAAGCRGRLEGAEAKLATLQSENSELRRLDEEIRRAETLKRARMKALADAGADFENALRAVAKNNEQAERAQKALARLSAAAAAGGVQRPPVESFTALDRRATEAGTLVLTLENLIDRRSALTDAVNEELSDARQKETLHAAGVTARFGEYLAKYPGTAAELDDSLESAPEFFRKLEEIEKDGLPRHERRFKELLETQSLQHFTTLNHELKKARTDIISRMAMVNASLADAPYSRLADGDTHLRIEVKDLRLADVEAFRTELGELIQNAWADDVTDAQAEARYQSIARFVDRFKSADAADQEWRRTVLDVRRHVAFTAVEFNAAGEVIETYFSGSGKSGGQRQKLTTTCLAAALRYQLMSDAASGSPEVSLPVFAPVILDEAFDKADSEFTDISMNIFRRFGFQMIVATPEKSVVTLEPYIGGAYYVVMENRRHSSGLAVTYDDETGRLDFKRLYAPVPKAAPKLKANGMSDDAGLGGLDALMAAAASEILETERDAPEELPPPPSLFGTEASS